MAKQETKDLMALSLDELSQEVKVLEVDLGKLKFDHAVTGLADPTVIKNTRREIARVKTEMRRREIAEMSEEQINMRSKIRARRARK